MSYESNSRGFSKPILIILVAAALAVAGVVFYNSKSASRHAQYGNQLSPPTKLENADTAGHSEIVIETKSMTADPDPVETTGTVEPTGAAENASGAGVDMDEILARYAGGDFNAKDQRQFYQFMNSGYGQQAFKNGLSGRNAEIIGQLLHKTLQDGGRPGVIQSYLTFQKYVQHQLKTTPWEQVFDEWPQQELGVLRAIGTLLTSAGKDRSQSISAADLDSAANIAQIRFAQDQRWGEPARVLVLVESLRASADTPLDADASCNRFFDDLSRQHCLEFASTL